MVQNRGSELSSSGPISQMLQNLAKIFLCPPLIPEFGANGVRKKWKIIVVFQFSLLHPSDPKVHGDPEVHFEENRIFQHEAVYIFS